jgi:hypothetical protein
MTNKHVRLILAVAIALLLIACGSDSQDVPSLNAAGDRQEVESTAAPGDSARDAEAAMMAFTECLREQGVDAYDPVVDAEGNVGKPELAQGVDPKSEELSAAWEACAHHLEGITFEKERVDLSEYLDQALATTTCLRDKGYDVDDPTAETLGEWKSSFKDVINWDDPRQVADYEECSGDEAAGQK